jgi:hypothetical protein
MLSFNIVEALSGGISLRMRKIEVRWLQRSPSRRHKNFVKAVYCLKISQVQLSAISHIVEPLLSVSRL